MRRIAALTTLLLLTGVSTTALADEPPERPKKSNKGDKSKGCSVGDQDDAMLGLAALAVLISAAALRRRPS